MDIKAIEETYNWKPQDGDYPSSKPFEESKTGIIKLLQKLNLLKYYFRISFTIRKYF